MQHIYALLLLPRWYRTNGHENKYGAQTAHMEVLKPHAGKAKVNNQFFSREPSLLQKRENIEIFVYLKQISPFPNNFGTYQGPRKQGAGIGKNCGLMKMIRAPGADPRARPGAELAFHCAADTRTVLFIVQEPHHIVPANKILQQDSAAPIATWGLVPFSPC